MGQHTILCFLRLKIFTTIYKSFRHVIMENVFDVPEEHTSHIFIAKHEGSVSFETSGPFSTTTRQQSSEETRELYSSLVYLLSISYWIYLMTEAYDKQLWKRNRKASRRLDICLERQKNYKNPQDSRFPAKDSKRTLPKWEYEMYSMTEHVWRAF